MRNNGITVAGIFIFNANGDMQSFAAERHYGDGQTAKKRNG
ncbi:MAG: DUF6544 family protein [Chitinophagaceae bacterium]